MAACAVVFIAMKEKTTDKLGNFYNYFVKIMHKNIIAY